jgi:phosphate:Na+ symporter
VRRTIARSLVAVCDSIGAALAGRPAPVRLEKDAVPVQEAADALRQAQLFLSDVTGPPDTDDEQQRLTATLHALHHASRLADAAAGGIDLGGGPEDIRAGELCAEAMHGAAAIAREVAASQVMSASPGAEAIAGKGANPADQALARLERCAGALREMLRTHRSATLGAVANGTLSADAALVRVEAVRSLDAFAHHAWRSAAHLAGRG